MTLKKEIYFRCFAPPQILCWTIFLFMSCAQPARNDKISAEDVHAAPLSTHLTISPGSETWRAPDTATIPHNDSGNLIRYGKDLVVRTALYLGPKGKVKQIANGMNCENCHLEAGTKLYANSFSAVHSIYPKFRSRSGTVENLEKRINDCMERSLNGEKLDTAGKEMQAMVAYINWVGKGVPKGVSPKGVSVIDLPLLDRAADTTAGRTGFMKNCIICHGLKGQGIKNNDGLTYKYPPLWGPDSYTNTAGMYRLSRFAGYIKFNMPYQATSTDKPALDDTEAWDIAAYVNSMPRPDKKFRNDWPDISKKPFDFPFGPYSDHFSEIQHKYGPYKAITDALSKN